jgi:hypothetical protein
VADVRVRQAVNADASVLGDLFRKSSLSNAGDRASLLAHPDALEFSVKHSRSTAFASR